MEFGKMWGYLKVPGVPPVKIEIAEMTMSFAGMSPDEWQKFLDGPTQTYTNGGAAMTPWTFAEICEAWEAFKAAHPPPLRTIYTTAEWFERLRAECAAAGPDQRFGDLARIRVVCLACAADCQAALEADLAEGRRSAIFRGGALFDPVEGARQFAIEEKRKGAGRG